MSGKPVVRVGFGDYDHNRDLWTGGVVVPECELECTTLAAPEEIFSRFLAGEWDAAEMSLAVSTALRGKGDDSLVVLPVFPARAYRHGSIYVRADGPQVPADLSGRRIGIPVWGQTAGVYVRGLLASDYGVDLKSIRWVQAGVNEPGRTEPVDLDTSDFDITAAPESSLDQLLIDGKVDAVISARPPECVVNRDRRVKRLFPKYTFDEMAYAEKTGIFPIMHTLVLRRSVYEENPEIADGLINAFTEAKNRSIERSMSLTVPSYPFPWSGAHAQRAKGLLGADFWPYGIEANQRSLDVFLEYCAAQSITPRRLTTSELFDRERSTSIHA